MRLRDRILLVYPIENSIRNSNKLSYISINVYNTKIYNNIRKSCCDKEMTSFPNRFFELADKN